MKVDSMKELEKVLDTYIEVAKAKGCKIRRRPGYSRFNNGQVCLVGALVEALDASESPIVTLYLGLNPDAAYALEAGFCGWNATPQMYRDFYDMGARLASKHCKEA